VVKYIFIPSVRAGPYVIIEFMNVFRTDLGLEQGLKGFEAESGVGGDLMNKNMFG
jgi:hypothetical protein